MVLDDNIDPMEYPEPELDNYEDEDEAWLAGHDNFNGNKNFSQNGNISSTVGMENVTKEKYENRNFDTKYNNENNQQDLTILAQIQTVPSLVLTVFYRGQPVHITLDGGATSNYIRKELCDRLGFKIYPNGQTSLLGDKKKPASLQ